MMVGFLEAERARRWQTYVEALEEERKKIQVFQRELPLCLGLVNQAIESYRQQMRSDGETSSDVPVLEEFMPIKRSSSREEEREEFEQQESSHRHQKKDVKSADDEEQHQEEITSDKKANWLQSVQLWNQHPDPCEEEAKPMKSIPMQAKVRGAFHPFHKEKRAPTMETPPPPAASSTADTGGRFTGGGGAAAEKDGHSHRKSRRCWSPELHRRFLNALQQLGGSHVATPKQIRELMKVDGLTNDEVKSHLQKYRLHTRRPSPAAPVSDGGSPQPPQFILVGGILSPTPEYAAAAEQPVTETSAAPTTKIYTPVAAPPLASQCRKNNNRSSSSSSRSSRGNGRSNSCSPATSASSFTVTASPQP